MSDAATPHPSAQQLSAFGLGKMCEAEAEAVARHLGECPACLRAAQRVTPDSFLGHVKRARPGGGTVALSRRAPAPAGLPPELAHHPRYRILRQLGRGGMGVVYLAEHTVMKQPRAVKVIDRALLSSREALARFHAEVMAAARLDHEYIVRAYDAEQAGSLHMLVMEYVEGASLAQLLQRQGPLPVAEACRYTHQAALGLQHAHERGMVHRDIKPANLMRTAAGKVKVLDFGLAQVRTERRLTQVDSFMGTPEYVAPEQALNARGADVRADVYGLGCTLYCLLAGRPPFEGGDVADMILAHMRQEARPLHERRRDVPAGLSAVVARMLAKDPAARYQTPIEVARALAAFVKPWAATAGPGSASQVSAAALAGAATVYAAHAPTPCAGQDRAAPGGLPSTLPEQPLPALPHQARPEAKCPPRPQETRLSGGAEPVAKDRRRCNRIATAAAVGVLPLVAGFLAVALRSPTGPTAPVATPRGQDSRDGVVAQAPPSETVPVETKATLVVNIDPPDAEVLVDGRKVVPTPRREGQPAEVVLGEGRRVVEFRKDGFKPHVREVSPRAGERVPIDVRLDAISDDVKAQIADLEMKLRDQPARFDWGIHNSLRHLYCFFDERKSCYHVDIILRHSPMDSYMLGILGARGAETEPAEAASRLLASARKYPEYRFLAAACQLKAAELTPDVRQRKELLTQVAQATGEGLDPYRDLARTMLAGMP
jgi:tRNA A-37 threonylcarbamoyl transferase component Bud32